MRPEGRGASHQIRFPHPIESLGRERLEAARREVEEAGGKALALPVDLADAQRVEDAAEKVEQASTECWL